MDNFFSNFYSKPYAFVGFLMFIVAGAVLYVWGLKKEQRRQTELKNMLLNNAALKVVKHLRNSDRITRNDIMKIVEDVKVSEFCSKKRAFVTDKKEFSISLIDYMLNKNLIIRDEKFYVLKK